MCKWKKCQNRSKFDKVMKSRNLVAFYGPFAIYEPLPGWQFPWLALDKTEGQMLPVETEELLAAGQRRILAWVSHPWCRSRQLTACTGPPGRRTISTAYKSDASYYTQTIRTGPSNEWIELYVCSVTILFGEGKIKELKFQLGHCLAIHFV